MEWESLGGIGTIQVPDRLQIMCANCGQELGKNCMLVITQKPDDKEQIYLTTRCSCGHAGSPVKVKISGKG